MSTALLDLDELTINGQGRRAHAKLMDAVTAVTMTETITGASTVTVTVEDIDRKLLRSELLHSTTKLVLDNAGFALCKVSKSGSSLTLTFEDIAIVALRKRKTFRKVAAGTMSRAEFVRLMVKEEGWIHFVDVPGPTAKVELSRGRQAKKSSGSTGTDGFQASALGGGLTDTPGAPETTDSKPSSGGKKTKKEKNAEENSWDAATRIMGEIQWRVFARRATIYVVPDSYLLDQGTSYQLTESSSGIDDIDYDWDIGKPAATASMTVRAGKRDLYAGSVVSLKDMGVGDGKWIVEEIARSPFSKTAQVRLLRPQPTLAEPVSTSATGDHGEDGFDASVLGSSVTGGVGPADGVHGDVGNAATAANFKVAKFVEVALAQRGKGYLWGAAGPDNFDCSGLVAYCSRQAGVSGIHQPVAFLHDICAQHHGLIPVPQAISTYGAILMRVTSGATDHVAISLGNGKTIEAMGRAYGVRIGNAKGRFDRGGLLPGMFT